MKIIIAGAGDIGSHLAELMSFQELDIVLIEENTEVLDLVAGRLDILPVYGDVTSISLLNNTEPWKAKLFISVTTNEETNLMSAILAKKLGAKKCIARVENKEFMQEDNLEIFRDLGIDNLFSPNKLAAEEISRLVHNTNFNNLYSFEDGRVSVTGFTVDTKSILCNLQLKDSTKYPELERVRLVALTRDHITIIPNGSTVIRNNDHVYMIADEENEKDLLNIVGKKTQKDIRKIMILGDTSLAFLTARELEKEYQITLVGADPVKCNRMAEKLSSTLVINSNYRNLDLLEAEGLLNMDMLISLTGNSESNIISCLSAKNRGISKTLAQVENKEYTYISQDIGVDTLINTKLIAASEIFRYIRKGQVEAVKTIHGTDAELIEYVIKKDNQLVKKPLKDIKFPQTATVGLVIRKNKTFVPNGNTVLNIDDKVIIFALPTAIQKIEKLFT